MTWTKEQYFDFLRSKSAVWPLNTVKDTRFAVELNILNRLEEIMRRDVDPAASWNLDRSQAEYVVKYRTAYVGLVIEYEIEDAAVIVPMSREVEYIYSIDKGPDLKFDLLIRYDGKIVYRRPLDEPEPSDDEAAKLAEEIFSKITD